MRADFKDSFLFLRKFSCYLEKIKVCKNFDEIWRKIWKTTEKIFFKNWSVLNVNEFWKKLSFSKKFSVTLGTLQDLKKKLDKLSKSCKLFMKLTKICLIV